MKIVLIPGLWLDGRAWAAVLPALRDAGHEPLALTLPGQGAEPDTATLEDQLETVLRAVGDGPALVVGHSASSKLAWLAADRRPEAVHAAVLLGGMPGAEGERHAPYFEPQDSMVSFPGWEAFAGPDSDDLSESHRDAFAAVSHPVPAAVTESLIHYTNPARHEVPMVLLCPEYSPEQARAWVESGELPEVSQARNVSYVDLDSGHWPMFSKPGALAALLVAAAENTAPGPVQAG